MALVAPEDLLEAANGARENAYAPFSGFKVGAALRTASGLIITGANVENTSYGLSRCAEQSAVTTMVSEGDRSFSEIVIFTEADPPVTPCGACRQILLEFSPEADLYTVGLSGAVRHYRVCDLLPDAFALDRHQG